MFSLVTCVEILSIQLFICLVIFVLHCGQEKLMFYSKNEQAQTVVLLPQHSYIITTTQLLKLFIYACLTVGLIISHTHAL